MNQEDIHKVLQEVGFLGDLENPNDESSSNSEQEIVQEDANTINRSEGQIRNKEEGEQKTVCLNIDLPSCTGHEDATFSNPVDDPLNPLRALLHETQDAAEIVGSSFYQTILAQAKAGPENMFPEAKESSSETNPILSTEPESNSDNPEPVRELIGDAQIIELHQDRGPLFEPNLIITTNPATPENNHNNPDPMGRVVQEIFKFIFESNSMLTRDPQLSEIHESRKPPSEPNRPNHDNDDPVAVIMAFLILLFVTLSRESILADDLKRKST